MSRWATKLWLMTWLEWIELFLPCCLGTAAERVAVAGKMAKSDACKAKAALLVLIGSVVAVGGAASRGAMNWLVPCLVEFLRSEDWTMRKVIAEALGKVALKKLSVLALQSNQLTGAILASLGHLGMLMRLDLSSIHLFGSIPTRLADVPSLQFYYSALKRLDDGFVYEHNSGLCGVVFSSLKACDASDHFNSSRPEPYGAGVDGLTRDIPKTTNVKLPGIILVSIAISTISIMTFALYRRWKQRLRNAFDIFESRLSTDQAKDIYRKKGIAREGGFGGER